MGKQNRKSGAAMIAVLCVMAILMTLCLSMLLSASVLIRNAQSRIYKEQCRVSAVSLSKELETDLCDDPESALYAYLETNLRTSGGSTWPYYNPDELGHGEKFKVYKDFAMSGADEKNLGTLTLRLYWEWERGGEEKDILLHMEVTAEKNGEQYTVHSVFGLGDDNGSRSWYFSERF